MRTDNRNTLEPILPPTHTHTQLLSLSLAISKSIIAFHRITHARVCVCVCIKQKLKKYIYHNAQRKAHAHSIDHAAHLSHLSPSLSLPATSRTLDHQIGESGVHRRAEAVEHRQPGFDRIDSSLSMAMSALLRTGRRRRRRRGRGHQRRRRRRRSGHW